MNILTDIAECKQTLPFVNITHILKYLPVTRDDMHLDQNVFLPFLSTVGECICQTLYRFATQQYYFVTMGECVGGKIKRWHSHCVKLN